MYKQYIIIYENFRIYIKMSFRCVKKYLGFPTFTEEFIRVFYECFISSFFSKTSFNSPDGAKAWANKTGT